MVGKRQLGYIFCVILIAFVSSCSRNEPEPATASDVQILSPTSTPPRSESSGTVGDSPSTSGNSSLTESIPSTGSEQNPTQANQQQYAIPTAVPVTIEGDQKVYQDSFGRFKLTFPEKFMVVNASDAPVSIHLMDTTALQGAGTSAAISIFVQDTAADIEKIAATAIDVFRKESGISDAELIIDQKIEFDGLQGIEQIMTYPLAGREMAVRIIYINHPQRTYAVSITTLQRDLDAYAADVEAFLRGMQIQQ